MNNKTIEIKKTNGDCAQYTGTVTVASYLGDRLIQKETHHNAGLNNLFKFISNCLQGNWYEAKYNRPCKLVMLKAATTENLSVSTPVNEDTKQFWSSDYAVCNPIMYDNAAASDYFSVEGSPASSATYHFRVPFLSLISGSQIKKLMLLPSIASDYAEDACAYFVLDNPIEVPVAGGNFTVIIDWTLTFTNSIE